MSRGQDENHESWGPIEDIRGLAEKTCRARGSAPRGARGARLPVYGAPDRKVALAENGGEFVVRVELAEASKKDVRVHVADTSVSVFARWSRESQAKDRVPRSEQLFSRTVRLPAPVKAQEARATFHDRVLKIFLPRKKPSQVRKIKVK